MKTLQIRIDVYGQFIKVTGNNFTHLYSAINSFLYRLSLYNYVKVRDPKTKRLVVKKTKEHEFYVIEEKQPGISRSDNCFRLPRSILDEFLEYVEYNEFDFILKHHEPIKAKEVDFNINKDFKPRDYQEKYAEAIINAKTNNILIDLQTGKGKTFIAMYALSKLKKRFAVLILPVYMEKWKNDILHLTDIKEDEILILQGSNNLLRLLETPDEELDKYKCFIISLPSMNSFIKSYLSGGFIGYGDIHPELLFEKMKVDTILNDEGHQHFHQVVKVSLFANVRLMLILTATLISNKRNVEYLYRTLIPDEHRISNIVAYDKYIKAFGIAYRFEDPKRISFKTSRGYNQAKFEKSVMRRKNVLRNYLEFIKELVDEFYIKRKRKEDDKCLIYAGTVKMCAIIRDYLREQYPDLIINKYTEEDPYDVILTSNIIVSTLQSAGVALDIPNLLTVIQTINIQSLSANEQTKGRLRKRDDGDVFFVFTYSEDIPQHIRYTKDRVEFFKDRVRELQFKRYGKQI